MRTPLEWRAREEVKNGLPDSEHGSEAPLRKWSVIDVSFLADFPMTEGEIGHEEEAFFG
jgi:hypothetical protein